VYVEWAVSGVVSAALGVFVTSLVPFQSLGASSLNMRACPLYSGAVKSSFFVRHLVHACVAASSQGLNLHAARQSIVLLKNAGDTLPLSQGTVKSIAVIGPNSQLVPLANCELGFWVMLRLCVH
jgi:hypothetical protein